MEETKTPVVQKAYMMAPGSSSLQYRIYELTLEDGIVADQKEIGNPDLKSVVLGRLIKLLVKL